MRYGIFSEVVKFVGAKFSGEFELDKLAQTSKISLGRVLQATNTSSSVKQPFCFHVLVCSKSKICIYLFMCLCVV